MIRALFILLIAAFPLRAEDSYPRVSGEFVLYLEDDLMTAAPTPGEEVNDVTATGYLYSELHLSPRWQVRNEIKYDVVSTAARDRILGGHAAWVRQLNVAYSAPGWSLYAGKFSPAFGFAFDYAPGLYGTYFAEDYRITERLGFGGSIDLAPDNHTLGLATYSTDTTFLSEVVGARKTLDDPLVYRPRRIKRDQGGAGNAAFPASWIATLSGEESALRYHLAVTYQKPGRDGVAHELGGAATVWLTPDLGPRQVLQFIGEVVHFENYNGGAADRTLATGTIRYELVGITAALAATTRNIHQPGPNTFEHIVSTAVGYRLTDDILFEVGWRRSREGGGVYKTVGALLTYYGKF